MFSPSCTRECLYLEEKNSVAWVRERTIPAERPPLVGEVSAKFADRGCHVVSLTDPYGRILGFIDLSRYFFFQVAPQMWGVDPVPDPLLRKSGSAGNRTRICRRELWPLDHRGGLVRVRVTLQLTVSQSVSHGVEPNLGLLTRDRITFFYITYINSVRTSQEAHYISVL
jgi:hypothetical protein